MRTKKAPAVIFFRNIPGDLKQAFKVWCLENGTTMKAELVKIAWDDVAVPKRIADALNALVEVIRQ